MTKVDVSKCPSPHSLVNKCARVLWKAVWLLLFRPSPRMCHAWRRLILRCFGAKIGRGVHVYPSCRVWGPWNLAMGDFSSLADYVDCYCVAVIEIGSHSNISQYTFLCTASHDHTQPTMPLIMSPIVIEDQVWICADVFVGPGVRIRQGAVVGARSSVFKDVESWTVVAGNPARGVKARLIGGH